jgi:hypothetical protein
MPRAASTPNQKSTRPVGNVFARQSIPAFQQPPGGGVGQDNPAPPPARSASARPAPRPKTPRAPKLHTKPPRSQKPSGSQTVQLTLWVKPRVKAELQRLAELETVSVSATGAALLEHALQQNIQTQYAALLDTIISRAVAKHIRSYSTRLAVLLVRVAFASEQTRSLVTNLLARQPGLTPAMLNTILDGSAKAAKGKITYKTPQLQNILDELDKWFSETLQDE